VVYLHKLFFERMAGEGVCAGAISPERRGSDSVLSEVYGGGERPGEAAGVGGRGIGPKFRGVVGGFVFKRARGEGGV
jgi:hypothetical protein